MHTERRHWATAITAVLLSCVVFSLFANIRDPLVRAHATNLPSASNLLLRPRISRDEIIARAKGWVQAQVPYDEYGWYQGYREDCSGYVSMAWQLSQSLTTYTLPSVSHQINKDDLQPGDILLNQWGGWTKYGSPDAHVVLFDSWVDNTHTHYNAYEESFYYGQAHYTTNIPYPYWPGYDSSDYIPMRLNGLSSPPPTTATPIPTSIPTPTTIPMPPTQTSCPDAGTARAAVMEPMVLGTHQNIVYVYNVGSQQAPTSGILKRYDVTTGQKTVFLNLPGTFISNSQISADGQWVLFTSQVAGQDALQLVRMDGQGLQTLHCAPLSQSISGMSWSPNQALLVFNEGVDIYACDRDMCDNHESPDTYLLDIANGSLESLLIQPSYNPNQYPFINYIPLYWIDNSRLYMQANNRSAEYSYGDLFLLDTTKGAHQQAADLLPVTKSPSAYCPGITLSPDGTNLFLSSTNCGTSGSFGPSSVTVQPATGGTQKTIYSNPKYAVIGIYTINKTSLLMLIENEPAIFDTSQNGLWKINTDGTGLTRLTTESNIESNNVLSNNDGTSPLQYHWSNISRDGSMYALKVDDFGQNTQMLFFGSLNGGTPTNFASTSDNSGNISIVGWTMM